MVHDCVHKNPPWRTILSETNPVHILKPNFFEVHVNSHPSFTPRPPKWSFSLFSLFWKNKIGLWNHFARYVCLPLSTFETCESWYVYFGSWAHLSACFIKPSHSVCVCMRIHSVAARQQLAKDVPSRGNEYMQQYKNCHFLCGPCLIKGDFYGSVYPLIIAR
jgi:hypothetical protein